MRPYKNVLSRGDAQGIPTAAMMSVLSASLLLLCLPAAVVVVSSMVFQGAMAVPTNFCPTSTLTTYNLVPTAAPDAFESNACAVSDALKISGASLPAAAAGAGATNIVTVVFRGGSIANGGALYVEGAPNLLTVPLHVLITGVTFGVNAVLAVSGVAWPHFSNVTMTGNTFTENSVANTVRLPHIISQLSAAVLIGNAPQDMQLGNMTIIGLEYNIIANSQSNPPALHATPILLMGLVLYEKATVAVRNNFLSVFGYPGANVALAIFGVPTGYVIGASGTGYKPLWRSAGPDAAILFDGNNFTMNTWSTFRSLSVISMMDTDFSQYPNGLVAFRRNTMNLNASIEGSSIGGGATSLGLGSQLLIEDNTAQHTGFGLVFISRSVLHLLGNGATFAVRRNRIETIGVPPPRFPYYGIRFHHLLNFTTAASAVSPTTASASSFVIIESNRFIQRSLSAADPLLLAPNTINATAIDFSNANIQRSASSTGVIRVIDNSVEASNSSLKRPLLDIGNVSLQATAGATTTPTPSTSIFVVCGNTYYGQRAEPRLPLPLVAALPTPSVADLFVPGAVRVPLNFSLWHPTNAATSNLSTYGKATDVVRTCSTFSASVTESASQSDGVRSESVADIATKTKTLLKAPTRTATEPIPPTTTSTTSTTAPTTTITTDAPTTTTTATTGTTTDAPTTTTTTVADTTTTTDAATSTTTTSSATVTATTDVPTTTTNSAVASSTTAPSPPPLPPCPTATEAPPIAMSVSASAVAADVAALVAPGAPPVLFNIAPAEAPLSSIVIPFSLPSVSAVASVVGMCVRRSSQQASVLSCQLTANAAAGATTPAAAATSTTTPAAAAAVSVLRSAEPAFIATGGPAASSPAGPTASTMTSAPAAGANCTVAVSPSATGSGGSTQQRYAVTLSLILTTSATTGDDGNGAAFVIMHRAAAVMVGASTGLAFLFDPSAVEAALLTLIVDAPCATSVYTTTSSATTSVQDKKEEEVGGIASMARYARYIINPFASLDPPLAALLLIASVLAVALLHAGLILVIAHSDKNNNKMKKRNHNNGDDNDTVHIHDINKDGNATTTRTSTSVTSAAAAAALRWHFPTVPFLVALVFVPGVAGATAASIRTHADGNGAGTSSAVIAMIVGALYLLVVPVIGAWVLNRIMCQHYFRSTTTTPSTATATEAADTTNNNSVTQQTLPQWLLRPVGHWCKDNHTTTTAASSVVEGLLLLARGGPSQHSLFAALWLLAVFTAALVVAPPASPSCTTRHAILAALLGAAAICMAITRPHRIRAVSLLSALGLCATAAAAAALAAATSNNKASSSATAANTTSSYSVIIFVAAMVAALASLARVVVILIATRCRHNDGAPDDDSTGAVALLPLDPSQ